MLELIVTSTLNGVLYGVLLFLMASGLTVIFSMLGGDKLVRFDMSEYQTLESIYRLLGHNGEEGLLGLNYDRVDGSGTLLFDEIEKAHERVLDLFLQLLSAARLTLGSGRVLNCF